MVGRSLVPDATTDEAVLYLTTVKKAFHDEPEKYYQFLKIMHDLSARRVGPATVIARMEKLLKDHLDLLLGFNAFLPAEFQITIPPEVNNEFGQFRNVSPEATMDDATSYLTAVKEALYDEPAKYAEIIKLLNDLRARRVDTASVIARVDELLKDHQNLLLGFSVFLSSKTNFIRKLKARFQGDGSLVVNSVLQILRMYREGNKSKDDAYQEVFALLQGHEDLVMEFSEIFSGLTYPSRSTSTRV
ncbi:PREDICTED: paired amphipathic helix protein Sin3-like 3 [Camelina sativa]|uniref:Paired amphipathic helix protein Sin3-like 3 n=1 Tax=Camelina sativa TaxID=90675 RepID=A0ABM0X4R3_CAMSA|nr:PREDICTED: paired amphipathic helix protein Sin3-like 3 [Camelina sativa]